MCRFKKKIMAGILIVTLGCAISACSISDAGSTGSGAETGGGASGQTGSQSQTPGGSGTDGNMSTGTNPAEAGGLTYLCNPGLDSACSTAEGFYYLTEEIEKLADGNYGSRLMYMDHATQQEIYLCSTAGCSHDTLDCPAVFLCDDFPVYSTKLFIYRDALYILSREADMDGSMTINTGIDENLAPANMEADPAVLYRADLDGTDRKAVYTFDGNLTLEDLVLGNDNGIYLVTKEVSVEQENNVVYNTSSKRTLVCLDPDTGTLQEVCSMEFDDPISWNVAGCSGDQLILYGTDYGKELSRDELWDDDSHKELFRNSYGVYAALDLKTGSKTELIRFSNQREHSGQVVGDQLYYSERDTGQVKSLNLFTGEEKLLCELPQNLVLSTLGDLLCCRDWDLSRDHTWYFVDTKTGEVSHSSLVNLCNGWDLEFQADLGEDVLVVYDYDAKANGDGSYEINQYKYALISKEDLLAGRDNYRKIEMIGKGN